MTSFNERLRKALDAIPEGVAKWKRDILGWARAKDTIPLADVLPPPPKRNVRGPLTPALDFLLLGAYDRIAVADPSRALAGVNPKEPVGELEKYQVIDSNNPLGLRAMRMFYTYNGKFYIPIPRQDLRTYMGKRERKSPRTGETHDAVLCAELTTTITQQDLPAKGSESQLVAKSVTVAAQKLVKIYKIELPPDLPELVSALTSLPVDNFRMTTWHGHYRAALYGAVKTLLAVKTAEEFVNALNVLVNSLYDSAKVDIEPVRMAEFKIGRSLLVSVVQNTLRNDDLSTAIYMVAEALGFKVSGQQLDKAVQDLAPNYMRWYSIGDLFKIAKAVDGDSIGDNGATSFNNLVHYMVENDHWSQEQAKKTLSELLGRISIMTGVNLQRLWSPAPEDEVEETPES